MRQQIESLVEAIEAARRERQEIDRDAEPRTWAQADLDYNEAAGHLGNEVREAARRLGLVRELGRALGGTGYGPGRLAFEVGPPARLVVELDRGPETPAERRKAADPATAERVRTVTEEFYSRVGIEILFPYDQLAP